MSGSPLPSKKNKFQFETIDSEARIFSLLRSLKSQQRAITLRFDNDPEPCSCTLLDAHGIEAYLVLGKLEPSTAYERFQRANRIRISGEANGSEFHCTTQLLSLTGTKQDRQFKVNLPRSMQYWQRRAAHRVHVSMALNIKAALNDDEGKSFIGQVRDISAGGMRVQFVKSDAQALDQNIHLTDCKITLHDNTDLHCRFEMRHLQRHESSKACTVGGQFASLDFTQTRAIRRFVATLERKSLRGFGARH